MEYTNIETDTSIIVTKSAIWASLNTVMGCIITVELVRSERTLTNTSESGVVLIENDPASVDCVIHTT